MVEKVKEADLYSEFRPGDGVTLTPTDVRDFFNNTSFTPGGGLSVSELQERLLRSPVLDTKVSKPTANNACVLWRND